MRLKLKLERPRGASTLWLVGIAACAIFAGVSTAGATLVLSGANVYSSNSDGSTSATGFGYRYTTNSAESASVLTVTDTTAGFTGSGTSAIALVLTTGANTFTFAGGGAVPPNGGNGLNLFFGSSSYNPTNQGTGPAGGVPGNLTVSEVVGGSTVVVPTAGITIERYDASNGTATAANFGAFANGNTSYTVGSQTISVSAYSVTANDAGTFTLTVAPEPASIGILAMGFLGLLCRRRKAS
jgi:hypothetical protein